MSGLWGTKNDRESGSKPTQAGAGNTGFHGKSSQQKYPCRRPRQRLGEKDQVLQVFCTHLTTLLAGIRADGATLKAFPGACSGRPVAEYESWVVASWQ